ncbi:hypothetical protein [Embleya sp. NPDC050493]|uniref:hypothetical protein n=1 Tax=Embleya sp. NPDC050493 TaxID=3363989 RepID=UPI0037A83CBE
MSHCSPCAARKHRHEDAAGFTRAWWCDPARPPKVRVAAALGWLRLVDDPPPEDLRHVLDEIVTNELGVLMAEVPWIRQVDDLSGTGLTRTLNDMLHPNPRPTVPTFRDTWRAPEDFADRLPS